jgi:hypothetical protein
MPNIFSFKGMSPPTRAEELERAIFQVHRIAKDNVEYLALFPSTGLCLHALNSILNVTTPALGLQQPAQEPSQNQIQLDLLEE